MTAEPAVWQHLALFLASDPYGRYGCPMLEIALMVIAIGAGLVVVDVLLPGLRRRWHEWPWWLEPRNPDRDC
jgi:hypothetical protein